MVVRTRLLLACATLLLAGGCFFKFNNPVSSQSNGSIAGRLALSNQAPGQTLTGATVSLQWSGLSVKVDQTNGKFLFLGLPAGTFTLRYDLPAAAGNLFPLIGFRHNLYLPGAPGQTDAINLGTVPITPSGRVEGNVSGGDGGPIVLGAFTPLQPDGGGHEFEGFTASTDSAGAFSLLLPAGNHDLACSTSIAVDAQPVTLQSQQTVTKNLGLASAALTNSSVTGFLVFGDLGVNADATSVDTLTMFVESTLTDENGSAVVAAPVSIASQVPGAGASFEQDLPPGHDYTVTLTLKGQPDAQLCTYFPPLVLHHIPGIAGKVAELGQVAWLQSSVFIDNGGPGTCTVPADGGVMDAGITTWQLFNAAAPNDAGAVEELVPLPVGDGLGGTKGHRLAWVQADGLVYTADDVASVATGGTAYGPTVQIWSNGAAPVFSISGASTASGGAAFGWVERNLSQATVAYYPPGAGSETPTISSFSLPAAPSNALASVALVAGSDSTGAAGLWVLILEDSSTGGLLEFWFTSDFVNYARATPIVPGAIDAGPVVATLQAGQVVGTPCKLPELDGGTGICIAATVNWLFNAGNWTYCAVLDPQPSTPTLSVQLIVDAGTGETFGVPAVTAGPLTGGSALSSVAAGWIHNATLGAEYQVSQFTTLSATPTAAPLTSIYGPLDNDAALLQWMGSPLAIATFPNHNPNGVGSLSLGTAVPPPFLPGFGVAQLLHGYTAPNGDLFMAAYDHPATNSTTQLGLFVWPPQL